MRGGGGRGGSEGSEGKGKGIDPERGGGGGKRTKRAEPQKKWQ